jgi:hypothetical protein
MWFHLCASVLNFVFSVHKVKEDTKLSSETIKNACRNNNVTCQQTVDVDWICLAQDRGRWRALVNSVFNLRVPYNSGQLSSVLTTRGRRIVCWWESQREGGH